jgi:uncharacterized protein (DUF1499 family)
MGMAVIVRVGMLLLAIGWMGCGGRMPESIGVDNGLFVACPDKPNCVSSFAGDASHQIAALEIEGSADAAWNGLQELVVNTPRVEIVASSENYIHAVYTSAVMRYRDDVEFLLRRGERDIAVRSASRVGHGDMGVNRNRIEAIRETLSEQGLVRSSAGD